jgi:hypothetical protein
MVMGDARQFQRVCEQKGDCITSKQGGIYFTSNVAVAELRCARKLGGDQVCFSYAMQIRSREAHTHGTQEPMANAGTAVIPIVQYVPKISITADSATKDTSW